MRGERGLALLAFATVCVVWGTTYLAIRVAIETLPTFLFAGTRFLIAGALLLAICAARGQAFPRGRADWLNLVIIGLLMVGFGNVAVVYAEHHISSGIAALLVATSPFWMAMLEGLRKDGERPNRRKILGMLIGFAGVAVLVAPEVRPGSMNLNFLYGVLAIQIGCLGWDYGSIRSKYHPTSATPLVSAGVQMFSGGAVVTLIGLTKGEAALFHFNSRTLIAYLYLVIFGSLIAYGSYVYALSKLRTSTVALYAYINPAIAVVLGWLILKEPLGWRSLAAMSIIFAGVALVRTGRMENAEWRMKNGRAKAGDSAAILPVTEGS